MSFYPPSVIIPVYAVFTTIGIILLGLRLWVRITLSPVGLGKDDALSIASVVFVASCTAIQLWNASAGTGGNAIDEHFRIEQIETAAKVNAAQGVIEVLAVGTIKLSLLFFYRRIFGILPSFSRINLASIWLIGIWTLVFFVAQMAICGDRMSYLWNYDQTLARGYCGSKANLLLVFAITSVLTDLLVLGLPIIYLRKVQMPPQKKWAASVIFLLGAVSTFACVLRTIFLCIAIPLGSMEWAYVAAPGEKPPLAMQVFNPTFWIMVEMWLGSWAANLLPVGPLYLAMFGRRRRRLRSNAGGGDISLVYEMGSRRDKVRGASAVEELDADSDSGPRGTSQVSFLNVHGREG